MQNEQTTCTVCIDFWNRQSCARVHARAVENMIWLWTAQLKVEGRCQSKDSRIARDQHLTDERWELLLGDGHDIPDLCLRDRYTCELLMLYHLAGFAQECLAFWGAVPPVRQGKSLRRRAMSCAKLPDRQGIWDAWPVTAILVILLWGCHQQFWWSVTRTRNRFKGP